MGITPIAFGNGTTDNEKEKPWIEGLVRKPVYDIVLDLDENIFKEGCVLLSDYSKQLGQNNIPRSVLQDTILDMEAEALPFARTNLISNSGIRGMRVNDEDQQAQVALASKSLTNAALTGKPWVPIVGNTEFQDLTANGINKSEEYLLYMQSLDNLRLSMYGIGEGGLFEKKAHVLQSEQAMNAGNEQLIYQDGLTLRQKFCDIVNSIWGLGIWCEASELVTGMDTNIIGRFHTKSASGGPNTTKLAILDLTEKSFGNANGIGLADFATKKLYNKINFDYTYLNAITSTEPNSIKLPMILDNDEMAIKACAKTCGILDTDKIKLVIIDNTKSLNEIYMSKSAYDSVKERDKIKIIEDEKEILFDDNHNLMNC